MYSPAMPLKDPAAKAAYNSAYQKALKAKDPAAFLKYHAAATKKYNSKNRELARARTRKWQAKNKDHVAAYKHAHIRSPVGRFKNAATIARRRGLAFEFGAAEYAEKIAANCFYCGGDLNPTGTGLDRIDNSLGYTPANTVACCCICNRARSTHFSSKEFLLVGAAIRRIREGRRQCTPDLL